MPALQKCFGIVFHDVKYLGLMWILGISVIGLPVIFIMVF